MPTFIMSSSLRDLSTGPKRPRPIGARYASVKAPDITHRIRYPLPQYLLDRFDDLFRREAELLKQHLGGRRGAEMFDAYYLPFQAHVVPPRGAHARFDGDAACDRLRQHA